jgi:hypothetical protein
MIRGDKDKDGLLHIWNSTVEENGWIILERADHTWALYENMEFMGRKPVIYMNHQLGEAIVVALMWS